MKANWKGIELDAGAKKPLSMQMADALRKMLMRGAWKTGDVLPYGGGDFEKSVEISMRCGWDSDCNPSNVGGILGCAHGLKGIPEKFKSTVNLHTKFLGSDYVRDVACVPEGDPRLEVTVAVVKDRPIRVALRVNGETAREETVTWSEKDVDGFTPINVGKMMIGDECFLPCTSHGIIKLVEFSGMDIRGKHAVVIGRSNIVGKPVAALLARRVAS